MVWMCGDGDFSKNSKTMKCVNDGLQFKCVTDKIKDGYYYDKNFFLWFQLGYFEFSFIDSFYSYTHTLADTDTVSNSVQKKMNKLNIQFSWKLFFSKKFIKNKKNMV